MVDEYKQSLLNVMFTKTTKGYQETSEKGKPLSKPNLTKQQAKKRLAQIEAIKHAKEK